MTPRIAYSMPFGAELLNGQGVRFRLWAPAAHNVDLWLKDGENEHIIPMQAGSNGWFEMTTELAQSGTGYCFRIDGGQHIPDPASRFQPQDVHGASEVIDAGSWCWQDIHWQGRPWEEAVIYELHVGSFTPQGNFSGVLNKLDYLANLGVTAIQLMPVADFPGKRNWGYDGTYLFAPDSQYGRPDDLKALIDAAHAHNLMVFLDVVYNHFGPEGNYLYLYAPHFFSKTHHTPWGTANNFDDLHSYWVRQFFIHNALYWLNEYHFDGLRLDAVHAIHDDSQPDILTELTQCVQKHFANDRHVHLILENDNNAARYLTRDHTEKPQRYTAQWNDDIHHSLHVLLSSESDGYYADYCKNPVNQLGRCLTEGFAYQGERSVYRDNQPRGETSTHLPPTAFVSFLQNHDQVGNRAFGERIQLLAESAQIHAAVALLLLAPSPPLLFMGEEWGCRQPFPFFCDFGPDLANQVITGRREEFARFPEFSNPEDRERIPNPMDKQTFQQAVLNWEESNRQDHIFWLKLYRQLLVLRHREIIPRLRNMTHRPKGFNQPGTHTLEAFWEMGDNARLYLFANFGDKPFSGCDFSSHTILYATHDNIQPHAHNATLPPWSVIWCLMKRFE